MLVLTQLSVGAFAAGLYVERSISADLAQLVRPLHGCLALLFGLVALAASTAHLGRPQYAFRALLGLKHSWMSREILAFGLFAGMACVYAGAAVLPANDWLPTDTLFQSHGITVVAVGGIAVFTSVMIYATLGREYWTFSRTAVRFLLTTALLGTATVWLSVVILVLARPSAETERLFALASELCCPAMALIASAKLIWEAAIMRYLLFPPMSQLKRSALLMTGPLANLTMARVACGMLGGIVIPVILMSQFAYGEGDLDRVTIAVLTALLFLACLAGELWERYLFFAAVAAPRMPGRIR
jgi:DMSO reductase anchor subunit